MILLRAAKLLPSGEHPPVVAVRAKQGDLVIDNLDANSPPWGDT
jgi:predicted transglutaminase-like cysteine proteinase